MSINNNPPSQPQKQQQQQLQQSLSHQQHHHSQTHTTHSQQQQLQSPHLHHNHPHHLYSPQMSGRFYGSHSHALPATVVPPAPVVTPATNNSNINSSALPANLTKSTSITSSSLDFPPTVYSTLPPSQHSSTNPNMLPQLHHSNSTPNPTAHMANVSHQLSTASRNFRPHLPPSPAPHHLHHHHHHYYHNDAKSIIVPSKRKHDIENTSSDPSALKRIKSDSDPIDVDQQTVVLTAAALGAVSTDHGGMELEQSYSNQLHAKSTPSIYELSHLPISKEIDDKIALSKKWMEVNNNNNNNHQQMAATGTATASNVIRPNFMTLEGCEAARLSVDFFRIVFILPFGLPRTPPPVPPFFYEHLSETFRYFSVRLTPFFLFGLCIGDGACGILRCYIDPKMLSKEFRMELRNDLTENPNCFKEQPYPKKRFFCLVDEFDRILKFLKYEKSTETSTKATTKTSSKTTTKTSKNQTAKQSREIKDSSDTKNKRTINNKPKSKQQSQQPQAKSKVSQQQPRTLVKRGVGKVTPSRSNQLRGRGRKKVTPKNKRKKQDSEEEDEDDFNEENQFDENADQNNNNNENDAGENKSENSEDNDDDEDDDEDDDDNDDDFEDDLVESSESSEESGSENEYRTTRSSQQQQQHRSTTGAITTTSKRVLLRNKKNKSKIIEDDDNEDDAGENYTKTHIEGDQQNNDDDRIYEEGMSDENQASESAMHVESNSHARSTSGSAQRRRILTRNKSVSSEEIPVGLKKKRAQTASRKPGSRNRLQIDDEDDTVTASSVSVSAATTTTTTTTRAATESSRIIEVELTNEKVSGSTAGEKEGKRSATKQSTLPPAKQALVSAATTTTATTTAGGSAKVAAGNQGKVTLENRLLKFKEKEAAIFGRIHDFEKRAKNLAENQNKTNAITHQFQLAVLEQKHAFTTLEIVNNLLSSE